MSFPERENELLSTLELITDVGIPYVLIGGWAVTAFNERFSTDVDLVIPETALEEYDSVLADNGYERSREYDTSALYEGRFLQYEKDVGNPVSVDLLVNAITCRQTDAEWSYRYLDQHSQSATVGWKRTVETRIPETELLLAIKLHSGRLTDARDVVAGAADAEFDRIEMHLHRGDLDALRTQLGGIREQLADESFVDSFKGTFQQKGLPSDDIERVKSFLIEQQERLE